MLQSKRGLNCLKANMKYVKYVNKLPAKIDNMKWVIPACFGLSVALTAAGIILLLSRGFSDMEAGWLFSIGADIFCMSICVMLCFSCVLNLKGRNEQTYVFVSLLTVNALTGAGIAENTGAYDEDLTYGNVLSMVELARYHKCKVILTSCLPAGGFSWRPSVTDSMDKIRKLNARVKAYAEANKIPYVDYFSAMVNAEGTAMKAELANDNPGVHPNADGYAVMESLLLPVIKKLR